MSNVAELKYLAKLVNEGNSFAGEYVALANDIDMQDMLFDGIGISETTPFAGTFDGRDHTIANLTLERFNNEYSGLSGYLSGYEYIGLFGYLSGSVKNVRLESLSVQADADAVDYGYIGGIAAYNIGTIASCRVQVDDIAADGFSYPSLGGIVGKNAGTVEDCESEIVFAAVKDSRRSVLTANVGGIAGTNGSTGVIRRCCTVDATLQIGTTVSASRGYWGGIAGTCDGVVRDCLVESVTPAGTVTGGTAYVGGIAGYLEQTPGKVENCLCNALGILDNVGNGTTCYIGGLVGYVRGTVSKSVATNGPCYATRQNGNTVTGRPVVGKVSGSSASVSNCYYNSAAVNTMCTTNGYGTGKTKASLLDKDFLSSTLGFSEDNGWEYGLRPNTDYPTLHCMLLLHGYVITIADCEGGSISADHLLAFKGQVITLTASPDQSDMVARFKVDGAYIAGNSFTVTGPHTVSAGFFRGGSCGANLSWYLDDTGTLIIYGTGTMTDFTYNSAPWYSCRSDIKAVEIRKGVTSIGNYAFNNCSSLTSIELPTGVTHIGGSAFSVCRSLTSIDLPAGVTSIGDHAFADCKSLASVVIPASVTSIGYCAFSNCANLESVLYFGTAETRQTIKFGSMNEDLTNASWHYIQSPADICRVTLGSSVHGEVGLSRMLYAKGETVTISCAPDVGYALDTVYVNGMAQKGTSFTITGNCTVTGSFKKWFDAVRGGRCGAWVTWGMDEAGTLYLCGTGAMTNYGSSDVLWDDYRSDVPWYDYRSDIRAVEILAGVTSIGSYAFYNCSSLTSIDLPDGVKSIWEHAFDNCRSLTSIELPTGVTYIPGGAFSGCSSLTSIELPTGVTSIGYASFRDCSSLMSIDLPDSVTSILGNAFYNCSSLTSIDIPTGVTYISSGVFNGCSSLTSIVLPSGVTSIGSDAFYNCTNLESVLYFGTAETRQNISIDDGNENLSNAAWHYIQSPADICTITAGSSLHGEVVLSRTFGVKGEKVEVKSVPDVGYELDKVYVNGIAQEGTSFTITGNCTVTVTFKKWFDAVRGGQCGDRVVWGMDEAGTLYICGTGDMRYSSRWDEYRSDIKAVEILEGVTGIGGSAFRDCSSLTSVALPAGLTSIGGSAFSNCANLASIEIPDSVTNIGEGAFYNCRRLTSIDLPEGLTDVETRVFHNCSGLASINLPVGVTHIGDRAFSGCSSLMRVVLPAGLTNIDSQAFYDCSSLMSIDIPTGVTSIGYSVFYSCSSLMSIYLPDGVKSIGEHAFQNCIRLAAITLPSGVTSIGSDAFYNCTNLESVLYYGTAETRQSIKLGSNNENLSNASWHYIQSPSDIYTITAGSSVHGEVVLARTFGVTGETVEVKYVPDVGYIMDTVYVNGIAQEGTSFTITGDCTVTASFKKLFDAVRGGQCGKWVSWGMDAADTLYIYGTGAMTDYFSSYAPWYDYRSDIKAVEILEGVTSIGSSAFSGCSNLTSIDLPDSVTYIGSGAFRGCRSLTSIELPTGVTSIRSWVFDDCSSLTSIVIPDSVTSIRDASFQGCSSLTSIDLPAGLTSIGSGAFNGCSSLTSIVIPDSVTTIESSAFSGCSSLTSIDLPDSVASIGSDAFYNCSSLTSIDLPDSVTSIGERAFRNCSSLTAIVLPASVTSIGGYAFYYCTILESVLYFGTAETRQSIELGNNNENLANAAWHYIQSPSEICTITIGSSAHGKAATRTFGLKGETAEVKYVSDLGYVMDTVYVDGIALDGTSFTITGDCTVTASFKKQFDAVRGGRCGDWVNWCMDEAGALYIYGSGTMSDYSSSYVPWYDYRSDIKTVEILDGVASIGSYAFYYCTNLMSIDLPDSVTSIGSYAFSGCSSLTSIELPAGVTSIGNSAFYKCVSLTTVQLPDGVTSIGSWVFEGCSNLTSVVIPASVTSIGSNAFYNCKALKYVWFEGDTPSISGAVFSYVSINAFYPAGNTSWTSDVFRNYSGYSANLNWKPWHRGKLAGMTEEPVDVKDLQALFTYLSLGEIENEAFQQLPRAFREAADVNQDGAVNILDYQALYLLIQK